MPSTPINLQGKRFKKLIVLKQGPHKGVNVRWICKCDCGKTKLIWGSALRNGLTGSCGCHMLVSNLKHGATANGKPTKEYRAWHDARMRCKSPKNESYHRYGGRGIKVCKRWQSSFANFLEDMGKSPDGYYLDRVNNDGNYCKSNCRWVTSRESANNRSTCKHLNL